MSSILTLRSRSLPFSSSSAPLKRSLYSTFTKCAVLLSKDESKLFINSYMRNSRLGRIVASETNFEAFNGILKSVMALYDSSSTSHKSNILSTVAPHTTLTKIQQICPTVTKNQFAYAIKKASCRESPIQAPSRTASRSQAMRLGKLLLNISSGSPLFRVARLGSLLLTFPLLRASIPPSFIPWTGQRSPLSELFSKMNQVWHSQDPSFIKTYRRISKKQPRKPIFAMSVNLAMLSRNPCTLFKHQTHRTQSWSSI